VELGDTLLWGDEPDEIAVAFSFLAVAYCDVEGGWPGEGNLDLDPGFRSGLGFDYLLRPGSPCIDAGDPALLDGVRWPRRYGNGPRSDMGAYGGPGDLGWLPSLQEIRAALRWEPEETER
jgi:hypothetical protein